MSQILPLIKRIAQNVRDKSGDGRLGKFFIFKLSRKAFAIPAVDVAEVSMPVSLIDIPQRSDFIMGVVNIRGIVIPVINLRSRLGLDTDYQMEDSSRLLLFSLKTGTYVAMMTDDIEYRLREGVVEAVVADKLEDKSFPEVDIDNTKYPVLMVDMWLERNEIEILLNVVESF
ncbi:MAG: chemotaxis protein CheW [Candidatus Riflebacteria bacterium]|nr:chemotaxis protein CheW [Candidatus Riflebacteria bacterium]